MAKGMLALRVPCSCVLYKLTCLLLAMRAWPDSLVEASKHDHPSMFCQADWAFCPAVISWSSMVASVWLLLGYCTSAEEAM